MLKKSSDAHCAKIIINKFKQMPFWRVVWYCHLLRRGMPVAKITHSKWFYGMDFYTNRYTLDPRPDTETLVESVIKDIKKTNTYNMLDLGTGTGCIICALCKNIPNATGVAIDKSKLALRVAKKNVKKFNLTPRIKLKYADFAKYKTNEKFDIIVSNPPYIKYGDIRVNNGAKFDPKIALYAKNNGLGAYEQIAKNTKNFLKKNGKIYLEIGIGQLKDVKKIFRFYGWDFERMEKDLSGINRVLIFTT